MTIGTFGWFDLSTDDVGRAADFYAALFGWQCRTDQANGGVYHRLSSDGRDVASLYQIDGRARARGMRAHWTPYVAVASVDASVARVTSADGTVLVRPFDVTHASSGRIARISLVADPGGAVLGLWENGRTTG
jgi:predicted enzyme related to lactoylglutathione lyase